MLMTRQRPKDRRQKADERLLTWMKELAPKRGYSWIERLPEAELAHAEALLGFPLPSLLRRIYLEVGNGAFGLSPLFRERFHGLEMPLIDSYVELRSESGRGKDGENIWPEKLLIISDWGCNISSCFDCAHHEQRVLRNDNNIDPDMYALEAPSFQQWLQALLDGALHLIGTQQQKSLYSKPILHQMRGRSSNYIKRHLYSRDNSSNALPFVPLPGDNEKEITSLNVGIYTYLLGGLLISIRGSAQKSYCFVHQVIHEKRGDACPCVRILCIGCG